MRESLDPPNLENDPFEDTDSIKDVDKKEIVEGPAPDGEVPDIEKLPITSLRRDSFWQ
ncbi:MAG: hypothetical protein NVS2B12_37750 [Ktedonobacteraceae bacterium]